VLPLLPSASTCLLFRLLPALEPLASHVSAFSAYTFCLLPFEFAFCTWEMEAFRAEETVPPVAPFAVLCLPFAFSLLSALSGSYWVPDRCLLLLLAFSVCSSTCVYPYILYSLPFGRFSFGRPSCVLWVGGRFSAEQPTSC
jgi:hypothetical protein